MTPETQAQHGSLSSGANDSENAYENSPDLLDLSNVVPDEHISQNRVRFVSHGTNDWNPSSDLQDLRSRRPVPSSCDDLDSVVKDAGYSLHPSDNADERPPERTYELGWVGTQFEADEKTEELETRIRRLRVSFVEKKHIFLPIDELERCMTADNIRHELIRTGGCPHIEDTTEALCQRGRKSIQRIFAILCMLDMSNYIDAFVQEGIVDTDLPFLFRDDVVFRTAPEGSPKPPKSIALFDSAVWTARLREFFDEYQRQLTAPIFKFSWLAHEKVLHFPLKSQLVLPFVYIADTEFEGGTSVVRKVKIHPAHYNAPKGVTSKSEMYFAVKELKLRRGIHEAVTLKRLNNKQHPHLIRLLATYTYDDLFHLIFPWANGNLGDFWETYSPQSSGQDRDSSRIIWMSKQILGLARALQVIHYCEIDKTNLPGLSAEDLKKMHGRHGDLKPENILWFKDDSSDQNDPMGVLKIADFGFADFHSKHSKSRVRRSAVPGVTYTYSAPEYDVRQQVSPQFDIWSFGCVLLQFIVWYLHGWDGIDKFSRKRTAESQGFVVRIDSFYLLHAGGTQAQLKESVTEKFRQLKKHRLCSDYILDLLEYVEKHLLRVDSAKRASIEEIVKSFEEMHEQCAESPEYCMSRQKEATLRGSTLPEIVELPEYQDQISPSTSPGKGLSDPQSPYSIWEGQSARSAGNEDARAEKVTADGSAGLGISALHPVVVQKPESDSRHGAILRNDEFLAHLHEHSKEEGPSPNTYGHTGGILDLTSQGAPQHIDDQLPSAEVTSNTLVSSFDTNIQSAEGQGLRLINRPSPSTSNHGDTVAFQAAPSSMPIVLAQDHSEDPPAPATAESRRKRSKKRIDKFLDFCLCIGSG